MPYSANATMFSALNVYDSVMITADENAQNAMPPLVPTIIIGFILIYDLSNLN
jgi:hypothetical protein